jgi:hypothetical protein
VKLNKLNPVVKKRYLLLLAGFMWFGVGLILIRYSIVWLIPLGKGALLFAISGLLSALLIHHFGFLKIVDKNLQRIEEMEDKMFIFSFMSLKSYFLVLIMISMGIALRHSPIPKKYLSVLYSGIGVALVLSSIRYFRMFSRHRKILSNK